MSLQTKDFALNFLENETQARVAFISKDMSSNDITTTRLAQILTQTSYNDLRTTKREAVKKECEN